MYLSVIVMSLLKMKTKKENGRVLISNTVKSEEYVI